MLAAVAARLRIAARERHHAVVLYGRQLALADRHRRARQACTAGESTIMEAVQRSIAGGLARRSGERPVRQGGDGQVQVIPDLLRRLDRSRRV